ncbi:MAG: peptidylprolyl isomerase [Thioalkalivibrionaceae bacterium]
MSFNITKGHKVTVQYQVFDDESGTPLTPESGLPEVSSVTYLHGYQQASIPGLSNALHGLEPGFVGEVTIPPALGYGEHRPELVFEAVRENLPADTPLTPGQPLYTQGERGTFQLRVVRLTDKGAILDGNHPLAGRTLRVAVKVLEVRAATAEELAAAGHA